MLKTAFILFLLLASGCKDQYTPSLYGYFQMTFLKNSGSLLPTLYPIKQSAQAILEADPDKQAEPGWMNLSYPQYNAKLHLSYKEINNDTALNHYLEDCHHLAYTHTIKAESINEKYSRIGKFSDSFIISKEIPLLPTQFFITDSIRHFLRGALYFNQHPDKDSLAPVIDYLREDIVTLMETLRFKNK